MNLREVSQLRYTELRNLKTSGADTALHYMHRACRRKRFLVHSADETSEVSIAIDNNGAQRRAAAWVLTRVLRLMGTAAPANMMHTV